MTSARRVDFSPNAAIYDQRHGTSLSAEAAHSLASAAALDSTSTVLDIGAGTGRVALSMAPRVSRVVALEPSPAMLERLLAKAAGTNIGCVIGEGDRLPFRSKSFRAVIIARLLYLTPGWRRVLEETHRVCAVDGCVLHEWGNGEPDERWVQIREKTREMFEDAGISAPFHPGARTESEVSDHVRAMGFVKEQDVVLGTGQPVTLGDFVARLVAGEFSYTWDIPDSIKADCLPRLSRWAEQTFDLDQPHPIPRAVRWAIYRRV